MSAIALRVRDQVHNWMRRHPRQSAAAVTLAAELLLVGIVYGYQAVTDRLIVERGLGSYQAAQRAVDELQPEIARLKGQLARGIPDAVERRRAEHRLLELQERLDPKRNDVKATLGLMLGLSFLRPDDRVTRTLVGNMHGTIEQAFRGEEYYFVKVFVEDRLAQLERLGVSIVKPEEIGYLKAALSRANAEIERRIAAGEPAK